MPEDKFNRFTERGRKVLSLSQEEARRFNHSYIGTEHMLLGLVREGDGVAAKVLSNMGMQLPKVRAAVESMVGRGSEMIVGEIGLTPKARQVMEHAVAEAHRLNHHYIGTEHLLLGLLQEPEGIGFQVLVNLGADPQVIRDRVYEVLFHATGQPYIPTIQEKSALFTDGARKALSLAQEEARRFNRSYVGTEHLLIALVRERDGIAAKVLHDMDVELPKVRSAVEFIAGHGDENVDGELQLAPRTRKVIELAIEEARRLNHHYVGPEHLLLGILREGEGIAAGVLESLGVNLERVRHRVLQIVSARSSAQPSEIVRPGESSTSRSVSYQVASGPGLDRLKGLLEEPEGGYSSPFTRPINIASVLHDMTPQNREALVRCEFGGLSTFDISRVLGLPRMAAKSVLSRSLEEFRQLYQQARQRESARTRVEQFVQAMCPGMFTIDLDDGSISLRHHYPWNEEAEANVRRVYNALVGWLVPDTQTDAEGGEPSRQIELKSDDDAQWISVSLALLTAD